MFLVVEQDPLRAFESQHTRVIEYEKYEEARIAYDTRRDNKFVKTDIWLTEIKEHRPSREED